MRRLHAVFVALFLLVSAALLGTQSGSNAHQARAETEGRTFLGFDSNQYPGDDALPLLRKTFSFTSYWIGPPPEEKSSTWLGKRSLLQSRGFGFVVLFNGRDSRNLKSATDARQKGALDGENAIKFARQEGFPLQTIL